MPIKTYNDRVFNYSFGSNDRFGIEVGLFSNDPIDYEVHSWAFLSLKLQLKLFGLYIYLFGIEIARDFSGVALLNCHIAVFY